MSEVQQAAGAEDWEGAKGENWLAHLDRFEGMIAPIGAALIAHAGFRAGERVVDIGCGGGATTIEIARTVGPAGEAWGIDISPALVAAGRRRAQDAGLSNASFLAANAAEARPQAAPFDRLFSRFGSMFFEDRRAAFANLRAMLRDGGRIDLAVWAPPAENLWFTEMTAIFGSHVELPEQDPRAPGPFALADPDDLRSLLEDSGFRQVEMTPWRGALLIGGAGADPGAAAAFVIEAMPLGALVAEQPLVRRQVEADLRGLFERHRAADGVRLAGTAWLVTASA
ncbi:MAG TPA: methyltransferase domain-containing protein [Allosphingosinicella sp.]|nr:methyltransferase domain-containing protein [Allosphingosinicella sp.]